MTTSRELLTKRQLLSLAPDVIVQEVRTSGGVEVGVEVGWEYLTLLHGDSDTAGITVMLCTTACESMRHPELVETLDRLGVRVLLKPIGLEDLLAAVAEMLATQVLISQAMDATDA